MDGQREEDGKVRNERRENTKVQRVGNKDLRGKKEWCRKVRRGRKYEEGNTGKNKYLSIINNLTLL